MRGRGSGVAVVGASESTRIGSVPDMSAMGLCIDAAVNALNDAGIRASDVDGVASVYNFPTELAFSLGIKPRWVDSVAVGGAAWMFLVANACAAIQAGYCNTVLVVHGESGRSRQSNYTYDLRPPGGFGDQFDFTAGMSGAVSMLALPAMRYLHEFGATERQLATVAVQQRLWARRNPRATLRTPLSVDDVLSAPMIAPPLTRPMCCLVSDGGGAIVLAAADRVGEFRPRPVYVSGIGLAADSYLTGVAFVDDMVRPSFARRAARQAFETAAIQTKDVRHLMLYDPFAHFVWLGLEALGFCEEGVAPSFVADGQTGPGGSLPTNTNGGGLSYVHSGSYSMFAMQESIRQVRGEAAAQVRDCGISVTHGWGGFFSSCATIVFTAER